MDSGPIGRRTRLQRAIKDNELSEEKRRRWFEARNSWRKRADRNVNVGLVNIDSDDNEFKVVALKVNPVKHSSSFEESGNMSGVGNDQHDIVHDENEESKNDNDRNKKDKGILKDDGNNKDSDDSIEIIGDRWNPDECYESHSSVTSSDSNDETIKIHWGAGVEVSGIGSSSSAQDIKEINDKDADIFGGCNDVKVDGGNINCCPLKKKDGLTRKRNERALNACVFRRFDGLVLPKAPENNARQNDFVSRRTRSRLKPKLPRKNIGDGTFTQPVVVDDGPSCSDGDKDDGHETPNNRGNANCCENVCLRKRGGQHRTVSVENKSRIELNTNAENVANRKRGRPHSTFCMENECEHELNTNLEAVCKRKRGRPRRTTYAEKEFEHEINTNIENVDKRKGGRPPKNQKAEDEYGHGQKNILVKTNEVKDIMLNTNLENGKAEMDKPVSSVSEVSLDSLPMKFNFQVHNSPPEKSKEEEETEGLFNDLDFAHRGCGAGCFVSCLEEDEGRDNVLSDENMVVQTELCPQRNHDLILDDEIGIVCKFCPFVKLEIRYVTPAFHNNPFGRSLNKN